MPEERSCSSSHYCWKPYPVCSRGVPLFPAGPMPAAGRAQWLPRSLREHDQSPRPRVECGAKVPLPVRVSRERVPVPVRVEVLRCFPVRLAGLVWLHLILAHLIAGCSVVRVRPSQAHSHSWRSWSRATNQLGQAGGG